MNRILLLEHEVGVGGMVCLEDRRARHVLDVLKPAAGETLRVGIVNGPAGTGTVVRAGDGCVTLECRFDDGMPPEPRVDIVLAVPRPKVMRRLWAPLASLGVRRIILTNAEKVERNYFDTHWLEPDVYVPLLIEGLEQAGDTRLPEVQIRRRFRPMVEDELDGLLGPGVRLLGHPDAGEIDAARSPARQVAVAVGPEGGWTPFEVTALQERGFVPVSLGWRRLRVDTACVALITMAQRLLK